MIPNKAHFIWIGDYFSWLSYISVLSCLRNGGFDEVHLHFLGPSNNSPYLESLKKFRVFKVHFSSFMNIFQECGEYASRLEELYQKVENSYVIKSNILRYAVLYSSGGVYFDCDFLVLKPFSKLLNEKNALLGKEKILAPYKVIKSRNPIIKLILKMKVLIRLLCAKIPKGYIIYNKLNINHEAFNNALIGSIEKGDLIIEIIESLLKIDCKKINKAYYTGTYLLQNVMELMKENTDISIYDFSYFFPISPIISEHLFKKYRQVRLEKIITDNAYALHWYSATFRNNSEFALSCTIDSLYEGNKKTIFYDIIEKFSINND